MLGLKIKQVCWRLVFVNLKKSMIANLLHIFVNKSGLFIFYKTAFNFENNGVLPSATNPITAQYLANIEFKKYDTKRIRSSRPEVFYQKVVIKKSKNSTKYLRQRNNFSKVIVCSPIALPELGLRCRSFLVSFYKIFQNSYSTEHLSAYKEVNFLACLLLSKSLFFLLNYEGVCLLQYFSCRLLGIHYLEECIYFEIPF